MIWSIVKIDPLTGKGKGWSEAERKTGLSRQTIVDFLQEHPTAKPTRKIQPKYEEKWEKTVGYEELTEYFRKFKDVKSATLKKYMRTAKEGWRFLKNKDPISWDLDDFLKLKENPKWKDLKAAKQMGLKPEDARMSFDKATALRNVMEALGHKEWQDYLPTKKLKRTKGQKVDWWFRKNEVRAITAAIEDFSAKMLFLMACYTGSRIMTYLRAEFGSLNLSVKGNETWAAYETKTSRGTVTKELNTKLVDHLKHYISVMKQSGRAERHDKIFPRGIGFYSKQLKEAAKRTGLCTTGPDPNNPKKIVDDLMHGHRVSWHMTRHTFASQLLAEGASLEHIMKQGPWASSDTLITYYGGAERAEIRKSMNLLDLG